MSSRTLLCGVVAACIVVAVLVPPQTSYAEPILKPRKYHGPIPKRYFTLGIGFMGGAENSEMWDFLDRQIVSTLEGETDTKDFGAGFNIDGTYTMKVHPQFAVRGRAGLTILTSESTGQLKPADVDTALVRFAREFDVWLFSMDLSGLYFFQDASVKNFQSYIGAGLGLYFPYSSYTQELTNLVTGDALPGSDQTAWDIQPGVHAVLGFQYHFNPATAVGLEGRLQMAMSKFELTYREALGKERTASFDVDYTGFVIGLFAAKFF
jgi:hypothetical protein